MSDGGLSLSLHALRRQLAAMPCQRYLIRLIHHRSRRAFPGSRLWTASQLGQERTVRFLRARNREGYDVYFQPYAGRANAGYILLDLDQPHPGVITAMRAQGHQPCVVLETSPGHLQAWVHVSTQPLPPAVASAIGHQLARSYHGDPASTDWRHVGRLAGFTNQKPSRRLPSGGPPWVLLRHATAGLARRRDSLLRSAWQPQALSAAPTAQPRQDSPPPGPVPPALAVCEPAAVYQSWLRRLRIPQRFPHPDWSIADLWIARQLLRSGLSPTAVKTILQHGSPGFPRHHAAPQDYLQRTITRARITATDPFPARPIPHPSS
jgi:RepB DNA-primase N-terminal domain/RepB DNA-primase C-terminal helical domain